MKLLSNIIRSPNEIEVQTIIREFEEISGYPQYVGAIDGCHSRIKAPLKDAEDYINRKDYHSIVYKDLLIIITCFAMYLWDGQENLMMPEYLKISPSIRSVYKEYFYPEPSLDIYKKLLLHHLYWVNQFIH